MFVVREMEAGQGCPWQLASEVKGPTPWIEQRNDDFLKFGVKREIKKNR